MTYERLMEITEFVIARLTGLEEMDGALNDLERFGVTEAELEELGYGEEAD